MDEIQRELIKAGRKDLAQKYYNKMAAKGKELEKHIIEIRLRDFTSDKDEPAYDVEVWNNNKTTMGGGKKQLYGIGTKYNYQSKTKQEALRKAKDRVQEILKQFKKIGEE